MTEVGAIEKTQTVEVSPEAQAEAQEVLSTADKEAGARTQTAASWQGKPATETLGDMAAGAQEKSPKYGPLQISDEERKVGEVALTLDQQEKIDGLSAQQASIASGELRVVVDLRTGKYSVVSLDGLGSDPEKFSSFEVARSEVPAPTQEQFAQELATGLGEDDNYTMKHIRSINQPDGSVEVIYGVFDENNALLSEMNANQAEEHGLGEWITPVEVENGESKVEAEIAKEILRGLTDLIERMDPGEDETVVENAIQGFMTGDVNRDDLDVILTRIIPEEVKKRDHIPELARLQLKIEEYLNS